MQKLSTFLSLLSIMLVIQTVSVKPQNFGLPNAARGREIPTEPVKVVLAYWNLARIKTSEALAKIPLLTTTTPGDFTINGDICHSEQPDYSKKQQFYVIRSGKRGVNSFIIQDNKGSVDEFYASIKNKKLVFSKILWEKQEEDEAVVKVEYITPETIETIYFLLTKETNGWKIFAITPSYDSENKYFAEKIKCLAEGSESNNSPARVVKKFWDVSFEKLKNEEKIKDLVLSAGSSRIRQEDICILDDPVFASSRNLTQKFSESITNYKFYETREGMIKNNRATVYLYYLRNKRSIPNNISFLLYKLDGRWKIVSVTNDVSLEKKYLADVSCR